MATPAQIASVRRYIYGGSTRTGTLSTDDIASYVDENPNTYLAASEAANAEALNAVSGGRKQVGDLSIDHGQTASHWRALAKALRMRGVRKIKPYSGGISEADKDSQETDTDWDKPSFRRSQFDYNTDGTSTGTFY